MLDIQPTETPADIAIEQLLLGSIMINSDALLMVEGLKPSHFHEPFHQRLFSEMQARHAASLGIDVRTLRLRFEKDEAFSAIDNGAGKYLARLVANSMTVVFPADLAEEIKAIYARRSLISHLKTAIDDAVAADEPAETIAAALGAKLENLTSETFKAFKTSYEVGCEILEDLTRNVEPDSTQISKLDIAMEGGLYAGKAYGFAARKKVGKTILAATLSHNLAQQGIKHLFICGEMGSKEIHQRVLARQTNCYISSFRSSYKDSPAFQRKIAETITKDNKHALYWNAPGITLADLQQKLAVAVKSFGIKGFILDYWQLVEGKEKNQSDPAHLDRVAQWIANFCRKHDVWAVVMAQLNQGDNTRGGEGIRLAFDQVYAIRAMGDNEDPSIPERWIEMLDTRYTKWVNIGDSVTPGLFLHDKGLFFAEYAPTNPLIA